MGGKFPGMISSSPISARCRPPSNSHHDSSPYRAGSEVQPEPPFHHTQPWPGGFHSPGFRHQAQVSTRRKPVSLSPAAGWLGNQGSAGLNGAMDGVDELHREEEGRGVYQQEEEEEEEEDRDDDAANEVIMAIDIKQRGMVGCAYYTAREERLHLMEDCQFGGEDVAEILKTFIDPTVILVPSRLDDSLILRWDPQFYSTGTESLSDQPDRTRAGYSLEVRPSPEFSHKIAMLRIELMSMRLAEEAQGGSLPPHEAALHSSTRIHGLAKPCPYMSVLKAGIESGNRITVGCIGALLAYIDRRRASIFLPGDRKAQSLLQIKDATMFSLGDSMFINSDTLHSLQIMRSESSPHIHNLGPSGQNQNSKEGLSVYGLFHHFARTPQGKLLLKQYFLRPSTSVELIDERLDAISFFLRPEFTHSVHRITASLAQIKNIRVSLIKLRRGVSGGGNKRLSRSVWVTLRVFCYHTLEILDAINEMAIPHLACPPIVTAIKSMFDLYEISQVGGRIETVVDFDESVIQHRTVVKETVDEKLDGLRFQFDGLESLLSTVQQALGSKIPRDILEEPLSVVYLPRVGFLIRLRNETDNPEMQDYLDRDEDRNWNLQFTEDNFFYYKTVEMREMDSTFGDLASIISDREIEIVHELAQEVLEHEDLLIQVSDTCGQLDALMALTTGAKTYGFNRPKVSSDRNVIQITGGRHPLQEMIVPSFVRNDTFIVGGPGSSTQESTSAAPCDQTCPPPVEAQGSIPDTETEPSLLILTGPNYSGKSVYMRQVAIIVYLAHVGSFVPSESAEIGVTTHILTRMLTLESVSRLQSTFMIDLQQINLMIKLAGPRSLLIIDEFGKGTNAVDGAGLFCGLIKYLSSRGPDRSKVLVSTHFHELFECGLIDPNESFFALGYMEVQIDEDTLALQPDSEHEKFRVTYLYNLRHGRSVASLGTHCARLYDIPESVVRRAEELNLLMCRGEDLVAACAASEESDRSREELIEAERIARDLLSTDWSKPPTEGDCSVRERLRAIFNGTGKTPTGRPSDQSGGLSRRREPLSPLLSL